MQRNGGNRVLDVEDLWVSYGSVRALSGVTLAVAAHSVVALLGPNGAGKSTTLRAISGVMPPERGRVTLKGCRVDGLRPSVIARKGMVHIPEGRGIFPNLTVKENLDMVRHAGFITGDPVSQVTRTFPILGERLQQSAGTLSGGEQQMLSLSRALVARPLLLMVDEISMGLAPVIVGQLFDALRELADSGTSILLVEQYLDAALGLSDYVYVLEKGRVVDAGEPGDVRAGKLESAYLGVGR